MSLRPRLRPRLDPSRCNAIPGIFAAFTLVGVSLGLSSDALAKGSVPIAQEFLEKGIAAKEKGDWKGACDAFGKSNDEVESVGALQQLGECNDKLGNYASSYSSYKRCEAVGLKKEDARGNECTASAKAVDAKVARITLKSAKPAPNMVVKQDGTDITSALALGDIRIDPGPHKIEISAPGFVTKTVDVTIGTTAETKVVDLPELEADPNDTSGVGGSTSSGAGGGDSGGKGGMSGVMIGGLIVGGVGAAGLIVGAITGGLAVGAAGDVETECPNQVCSTDAGKDSLSSAKTMATVSTVGFIAGGVLLAGGAVMVIIGATSGGKKSDEKTATSLYMLPAVSPDFGGAIFGGSF